MFFKLIKGSTLQCFWIKKNYYIIGFNKETLKEPKYSAAKFHTKYFRVPICLGDN